MKDTSSFKTIEWKDDTVVMIDQRRLPSEEVYVTCKNYKEVATAIKEMTIRGAPAIGVAAAMGIALAFCDHTLNGTTPLEHFEIVSRTLTKTRPTAVNLFWAVKRMKSLFTKIQDKSLSFIRATLKKEALRICEEDVATCQQIGKQGAPLISNGGTIMTHCNAGALGTAGHGTALGVLYTAKEQGKKFQVLACETRPLLQGARLTAWELQKSGIPVTLITDNMAGALMQKGLIHAVLVGADRIAANGDVANKIGTYSHARLAEIHQIPFYVAAPSSTIDTNCPSGDQIPIEERASEEVIHFHKQVVAPRGIAVKNLAFDVTPAEFITALITEKGIMQSPDREKIKQLISS